MSVKSEANPYSLASLSGKAPTKATTVMRRLRLGMRQSRSSEDLASISEAIIEERKTAGIYVLKMNGIPCGCDHNSMVALDREIARKKEWYSSSNKAPYAFCDDFYPRLESLYLNNDQEALTRWLEHWVNAQNSGHFQGDHAWLELEAVLTQMLLQLGRYDEALSRAEEALRLFPHDDFLLYCKAQALIERAPGFLFFGPNKQADYQDAERILLEFGEAKNDVPLFQSKHDFVWALWHQAIAKASDTDSRATARHKQMAIACAERVPTHSIYASRAQMICHTERDVSLCGSTTTQPR